MFGRALARMIGPAAGVSEGAEFPVRADELLDPAAGFGRHQAECQFADDFMACVTPSMGFSRDRQKPKDDNENAFHLQSPTSVAVSACHRLQFGYARLSHAKASPTLPTPDPLRCEDIVAQIPQEVNLRVKKYYLLGRNDSLSNASCSPPYGFSPCLEGQSLFEYVSYIEGYNSGQRRPVRKRVKTTGSLPPLRQHTSCVPSDLVGGESL